MTAPHPLDPAEQERQRAALTRLADMYLDRGGRHRGGLWAQLGRWLLGGNRWHDRHCDRVVAACYADIAKLEPPGGAR